VVYSPEPTFEAPSELPTAYPAERTEAPWQREMQPPATVETVSQDYAPWTDAPPVPGNGSPHAGRSSDAVLQSSAAPMDTLPTSPPPTATVPPIAPSPAPPPQPER